MQAMLTMNALKAPDAAGTIKAVAAEAGLPLEVREDRHFHVTVREFAAHARGRKSLRMEYFYREMRKRHGEAARDENGRVDGGDGLGVVGATARFALFGYSGRHHHWPGNIRELQNVIERGVILARSELTPTELPVEIASQRSAGNERGNVLKSRETDAIIATLQRFRGNRRQTADALGISLRTLQYRLKELGLLNKIY